MSNDVVQGLCYYILLVKNLAKWTIYFMLSSKIASCQVIEVLAVFNTNLYLAPFDKSLSNLIIYKNWILIFIYYKSA